MNQSEAVICCQVLASLIVSDDDVTQEEHLYLQHTMEVLGLDEDERRAAMTVMGPAELEAAMAGLDAGVQAGLLEALLQVALADGEFHESEKAFVYRAADVMGLGREKVEQAWIAAMKTM